MSQGTPQSAFSNSFLNHSRGPNSDHFNFPQRFYWVIIRADSLVLPDDDIDTGKSTQPGEYSPTNEAYAKLLIRLSDRKFDPTSSDLRGNILKFYSDHSAPIDTKNKEGRWRKVLTSIDQLKSATSLPSVTDVGIRVNPNIPGQSAATPAMPATN